MTHAATQEPRGNPLGYEKIGTLIRRFSVPAIISLVVNALYNIVDQIFIGQGIGTVGMAATNVSFPLTTICLATALLLGVGGASNFSLNMGRKDPDRAAQVAGTSLSLLAISGVVIGVLVIAFLEPLLYAFGATEQSMPFAVSYTSIVAAGIPFMIFSAGVTHLIRADGGPVFSMISMLAGAVFNVIFDPIFMYTCNMGIAGIALATTLGQVLSTGIVLFYLLRKFHSVPLRRQHLRPRADSARAICSLGMAACFNQLAMTVVQIVMNNVLRHYGALSVYGSDIPLACVGAIAKVNVLFLSFTIGIAQGCQPIIGFNYGAGHYGRVRQTYKTAIIAASCFSVATFLIFQLFPRQVISIFGQGSELYFSFAIRYLRIFMLMTFLNGIQPITSNFFTSIGKAKMGLFMSLTRQIIFLIPLVLLFPLFLGIDGVMYAGPIADGAAVSLAIALVTREFRIMKKLDAQEESL